MADILNNMESWDGHTHSEIELYLKNELANVVDKDSLEGAGIKSKNYVPLFGGEFTVTTSVTEGMEHPYAKATVTGRISKHYSYRVTIGSTEYFVPCGLTYSHSENKCLEYLGDFSYLGDGWFTQDDVQNVPFLIVSDRDDASGIEVFTDTAKTISIKVEQIQYTFKEIPKELIYGDAYFPVKYLDNGGTYNGVSIGVNKLTNTRGTVAIGYGNEVSGDFAQAFGFNTVASGNYSHAEGDRVISSGRASHAEGLTAVLSGTRYVVTASGDGSHAEGIGTKAAGNGSHAEGNYSQTSANFSHAEGQMTVTSGLMSHAEGNFTIAQGRAEHAQGQYNKSNFVNDGKGTNWGNPGNTLHSIGIGTSENTRKNGVEVMQNGDVYIIGIGGYDGTNANTEGVKTVQVLIADLISRIEQIENK